MSKMITGAEFRNFYQNNWPEGAWHEDMEPEYADKIEDDVGNYILPDTSVLDMSKLGYVVCRVDGEDVWRPFAEVYVEIMEPKQETVTSFVIPNDKLEQALAAMAELGLTPLGSKETAVDDAPQP